MVADAQTICGVPDCGASVPSLEPGNTSSLRGWATVEQDGTSTLICSGCANRLFWPKGMPYENRTAIVRPCPHCHNLIACGCTCPCIRDEQYCSRRGSDLSPDSRN